MKDATIVLNSFSCFDFFFLVLFIAMFVIFPVLCFSWDDHSRSHFFYLLISLLLCKLQLLLIGGRVDKALNEVENFCRDSNTPLPFRYWNPPKTLTALYFASNH